MKDAEALRQEIVAKTREYFHSKFATSEFDPTKNKVNYAGRVFDQDELIHAVEASLDFWLTEGRFSEEFADKIADFLDLDHVLLTNSGSSANLLAFSALTSEVLGRKKTETRRRSYFCSGWIPRNCYSNYSTGVDPGFCGC